MQLVDNDSFLKQLTALFESSKDQGSIWLEHKRLTHDGEDSAMKQPEGTVDDTREYPVILRVTDGGTVKFSTHILPSQLPQFHTAYGALLKSSMSTLRKRDKKREKLRQEQFTRRKKRLEEPIVIEGPKRGNGRRVRQRRVKAAVKQQKAKERVEERKS